MCLLNLCHLMTKSPICRGNTIDLLSDEVDPTLENAMEPCGAILRGEAGGDLQLVQYWIYFHQVNPTNDIPSSGFVET